MQRITKSSLILAAVAGTAIASYCSGAMAQSGAVRPGNELRTLSATPSDVADGKRLANGIALGHSIGPNSKLYVMQALSGG